MALNMILGNDHRAPSEGRQAVTAFLQEEHLAHLVDDAALLTSELVTNAVRHAEGQIVLRAYVRDGYLRLEVCDGAAEHAPLRRVAHPDDERGRGMELVDTMAAEWGWQTRGEGKVVWLDLPV